jgi:cytochrome b561
MLAYVHPVTAALVVALFVYTGSLGLRARSDRRRAPQLLQLHARLGPVAFVLMLVSWVGGYLSTWLLRHDLELGASAHMSIGFALAAAVVGGFGTSRFMRVPLVRAAHPWCLQITP